jgi:hypothetical protein
MHWDGLFERTSVRATPCLRAGASGWRDGHHTGAELNVSSGAGCGLNGPTAAANGLN